jgi:hypothetical protein
MSARGITLNKLFKRYYEPAYLEGYNIFKSMYITYYNSYVSRRKKFSRPVRDRSTEDDYISETVERYQVSIFDFARAHGERFFLEPYIRIRNLEENAILTEQKVVHLVERSVELMEHKGMQKTLKHINKMLCDTTRRDGSQAGKMNKQYNRDIEQAKIENTPQAGTLKY